MKLKNETNEKLVELAKQYKKPSECKELYGYLYKLLKDRKLTQTVWPIEDRERNPVFTKESLTELAKNCISRSDFQKKYASAYNAARLLGIVKDLFPVTHKYDLFGRLPYTEDELIAETKKYKSRVEFEIKNNGCYQTAQRRGIVAKYGPKKMQGTSLAEQEMLEFLKSIIPDFTTKRFHNDYELDCYSESRKLGVEYNGFYFHSEAKVKPNYHINKTKYFKSLGIRVIHIWEDEWRDHREQVKDFLKSACGANITRIYARKCEFKSVDSKLARDFLDKCHIQGSTNSVRLAIGCYYNNELVSVATFGRHHRKDGMVLNRFACISGITVCGGLSKMSKMAIKELDCDILSWADISKSQATGYLQAGWEIINTLRPDYFYFDQKTRNRVAKQSRKKSSVNTPIGMTEREHAKKDGLLRIYDCGKTLLVFKK